MMHSYNEIRTNFVKGEIKKTKWKDREYIQRLLWHEEWASRYEFDVLYPKPDEEYFQEGKKIWKELKHEEFKYLEKLNNLKFKKKTIEQRKEERRKERLEDLKEEKREWKEMGGLP